MDIAPLAGPTGGAARLGPSRASRSRLRAGGDSARRRGAPARQPGRRLRRATAQNIASAPL